MRYALPITIVLLVLSLVPGCGRSPANRGRAAELRAWLGEQSYSVWSTFRRGGDSREAPARPDGLTLGNHHFLISF